MLFAQGQGGLIKETLEVKKHREALVVRTVGPKGKQGCCSGSQSSRWAYAGSPHSDSAQGVTVTQFTQVSAVPTAAPLARTHAMFLHTPSLPRGFCLFTDVLIVHLALTPPWESPRVSLSHSSVQRVWSFCRTTPRASTGSPRAALEAPRPSQRWGHLCRTRSPMLKKRPGAVVSVQLLCGTACSGVALF